MNLSLRMKTILGTALIEGILLLLLVFTATKFMTDTLNENMLKRAQTTAKLFSTTTKDAVLSFDLASLDAFAREVLNNPDIAYARIVAPDGQVYAEAGQANILARDFEVDLDFVSVTDGVYDTYSEIIEAGNVYGRVELGIHIDSLQLALNNIKRWTATIAAVEILLVAFFSYLLGGYLTGRLQSLASATKKVGKAVLSGDFSNSRLRITNKDEVSQLAGSFNLLVDTLEEESFNVKQAQRELNELNLTLESRVQRRTQELADKNEQLEKVYKDYNSAQQQLMQSEKMASVGQLAAGVAHEINNPVGFVSSNVNIMSDYNKVFFSLSQQIKEFLDVAAQGDESKINRQITQLRDFYEARDIDYIVTDAKDLITDANEGLTRISDIVQNLKVFSRADTDEKQEFDINTCITTTLKMVKAQLSKNAEVHTQLSAVPKTYFNVGRINQVLTNLLVNAGQAMEKYGRIMIKSGVSDGFIVVQVMDTGKGMDEETMKNIFNPFFTTKPEGEGTGLGLSISYDIAQEHGGSLTVESKVGRGSCFTLKLPIDETSSKASN